MTMAVAIPTAIRTATGRQTERQRDSTPAGGILLP